MKLWRHKELNDLCVCDELPLRYQDRPEDWEPINLSDITDHPKPREPRVLWARMRGNYVEWADSHGPFSDGVKFIEVLP